MTTGALDGIRVLDLGRVIAAPYAAQMLADYGADVIKVERPGSGDDARQMQASCLSDDAGHPLPDDTSILVLANRNKRSITLDLSRPHGQAIAQRLAAACDVVIENFTVGTAARLGMGYEALRALNPGLVYCSISGYGQTGPYARRPGYDALLQAVTGFMSVTGLPDGSPGAGPVRAGASIIDVASGINAAFAVLAALRHRDRTGEGQYIDVSLFDSGIALQADNIQKFLFNGDLVGRHGNENYGGAPARVFDAADGSLYVIGGGNATFAALCRVLGCEGLVADERFASIAKRFQHKQALNAALAQHMASWPRQALIEALEAANVPAGLVNDYAQLFDDPHTAARGSAVTVAHPRSRELKVIASPARLSATPARYERPPGLGEHTHQVLQEILDLSGEEIAQLRQDGLV